jgi:uncharacterized membrane protein
MEKLMALWKRVTDSLWFIPALLTLGSAVLALLLIAYNDQLVGDLDAAELWWLFGGSADGARSVLESISGSIITVTGVVFSVTIIALQLASSQFTPRVLRQFMASRSNQLVLGVFIGTFTFTLLVQRTVNSGEVGEEFIPAVAVTVALLLALTSIGFLIYFIDHAARSIQASTIIANVTQDTLAAVATVFPEQVEGARGRPDVAAEELTPADAGEGCRVPARKAGYLQAVARKELQKIATKHQLLARVEVEIGLYVLPGQPILTVWPAQGVTDEIKTELCDVMIFGFDRTQHQDIKHGMIELMDIAVKGMSPAINDPTTAINAIHGLSRILLDLAWRERGDTADEDDDGRTVVIMRRPRLDDITDVAFNQIRHYSADNATVAATMMETLGLLAAQSPQEARAPFIRHLEEIIRTANARITDETDVKRIQAAAAEALKLAESPPPRRRPM